MKGALIGIVVIVTNIFTYVVAYRVGRQKGWFDDMTLIDKEKLIAEYDRVHVGPPGGARKLMAEAEEVPAIPLDWIRGYIEMCDMIQLRVNVPASKVIKTMVKIWEQENPGAKKGEQHETD
jgi:hypothetical protein